MVQEVVDVEPELQALAFREPERLRQVGVKTEDRERTKNVLTQIPLFSGKRILENDLPEIPAAIVKRNSAGCTGRDHSGYSLQSAAGSGAGASSPRLLLAWLRRV